MVQRYQLDSWHQGDELALMLSEVMQNQIVAHYWLGGESPAAFACQICLSLYPVGLHRLARLNVAKC